MKVKELVEQLENFDPEADIHIMSDRGHYQKIEDINSGDLISAAPDGSHVCNVIIISVN